MHPAPSIILFTTLNGAGFGLLALICIGLGPSSNSALLWGSAILGFAMAVGGLMFSTMHLGHPERSLRALTQWRTSWLSREGVLAILALAVMGVYFALLLLFGVRTDLLGMISAVLAVAAVYSTSMIYAQLKSVPRWNNVLTPATFLACSFSSGTLSLILMIGLFEAVPQSLTFFAVIALVAMWAVIIAYWRSFQKRMPDNKHKEPSPESATGLGGMGRVRLLESPHTSPNYLTHEMMYMIGRKHSRVVRKIAILVGGVLPLFLIAISNFGVSIYLSIAPAFVLHISGIAMTRWLFFAEAEHVVSTYYGSNLNEIS